MSLRWLRTVLVAGCAGLASTCALTGCGEEEEQPDTRPAGGVFYVAPDGSDSNSGSKQAPFRTIAKGMSELRRGATTYVRGGIYREDVTLKAPDCESSPCVLRNAPGERPVLQGLLRLEGGSGWTIDGLDVTWNPGEEDDEHMVKVQDGSDWTLKRMEMSGAHSFANLLIIGDPRSWRVTENCIHDTYPTNDVNQDHNVYVNIGDDSRDGMIDRNLLFNATNGSNLKLGGPDADSSRTSNLVVSHNTMYNAAQNILVSGGSHDIRFDRNITARSSLRSYRAYMLTGEDVELVSGLASGAEALLYSDSGYRALAVERLETVADPQFDRLDCGGFRPEERAAQRYGAYAP